MQDTNEKTNAHKFTDLHGNQWELVITVAEYRMLKDSHGVDIGRIFDKDDNWISQILAQDDMITLPLILHDLCKDQCEAGGIDEETFFKGLCGDTLSSATDALLQAVSNFTPVHKRQALQVIVDNLRKGMQAVTDKVVSREMEIQQVMMENIGEQIDLQLNLTSTSKKSSSKPPASAKSTRRRSRSTKS